MFIESLRDLPDDFKVTPEQIQLIKNEIFKNNPKLEMLRKETETEEAFHRRIIPAFVLEYIIAKELNDIYYSSRDTDTTDWNSFSWDVLDPKTGCRLEIKCASSHDVVITFADYSMSNRRFAYNANNKVNNTIHIDNFVHDNSKADALFVASHSVDEDGNYFYKTRFIGERLAVLKGYNNNGPSLFSRSKFKNGGLYIQGHCVTIPEWISKMVKIPETKIFTSDE